MQNRALKLANDRARERQTVRERERQTERGREESKRQYEIAGDHAR